MVSQEWKGKLKKNILRWEIAYGINTAAQQKMLG